MQRACLACGSIGWEDPACAECAAHRKRAKAPERPHAAMVRRQLGEAARGRTATTKLQRDYPMRGPRARRHGELISPAGLVLTRRHMGQPVTEVAREDAGYLQWLLGVESSMTAAGRRRATVALVAFRRGGLSQAVSATAAGVEMTRPEIYSKPGHFNVVWQPPHLPDDADIAFLTCANGHRQNPTADISPAEWADEHSLHAVVTVHVKLCRHKAWG